MLMCIITFLCKFSRSEGCFNTALKFHILHDFTNICWKPGWNLQPQRVNHLLTVDCLVLLLTVFNCSTIAANHRLIVELVQVLSCIPSGILTRQMFSPILYVHFPVNTRTYGVFIYACHIMAFEFSSQKMLTQCTVPYDHFTVIASQKRPAASFTVIFYLILKLQIK